MAITCIKGATLVLWRVNCNRILHMDQYNAHFVEWCCFNMEIDTMASFKCSINSSVLRTCPALFAFPNIHIDICCIGNVLIVRQGHVRWTLLIEFANELRDQPKIIYVFAVCTPNSIAITI